MDVDLVLWLVLLVRSELPSFLVGVFTWFGCPRWFGWCDCCVILSALRFAVFVVGGVLVEFGDVGVSGCHGAGLVGMWV